MRSPWFALLALILAALMGAAASLISQALFLQSATAMKGAHSHSGAGMVTDYHEWIHAQLEITPEQHQALEEIEETFKKRMSELDTQIRAANGALGDAMQADKARTKRVEGILTSIHGLQKELQEATIEHFFEMQPHLTEEQFEKLLTLMSEALHGVPHAHTD